MDKDDRVRTDRFAPFDPRYEADNSSIASALANGTKATADDVRHHALDASPYIYMAWGHAAPRPDMISAQTYERWSDPAIFEARRMLKRVCNPDGSLKR